MPYDNKGKGRKQKADPNVGDVVEITHIATGFMLDGTVTDREVGDDGTIHYQINGDQWWSQADLIFWADQ